jgi:hypothetical protein
MNNNNSLETKTYTLDDTTLVFIDLTNYFQWKLQVIDVVGAGFVNVFTDEYDLNTYFQVAPMLQSAASIFEMDGYAKNDGVQTHIWVRMDAGTGTLNVIGSLRRG